MTVYLKAITNNRVTNFVYNNVPFQSVSKYINVYNTAMLFQPVTIVAASLGLLYFAKQANTTKNQKNAAFIGAIVTAALGAFSFYNFFNPTNMDSMLETKIDHCLEEFWSCVYS
ncbi:hypothetical protein LCGC14_1922640 [marine sediment metagenome]|uniref:Uncharacterized protein n=1 Tax=marine sediment metagenome TaxID=412755 RepID=A0A0F9IN33_9ZZZZ|nr:hypothetical protein [Candidatus Anoxychlamydiales bacterium]HEU64198.1 hypothetical protein [Chlamydiota bacterium]